jgi:hypothetical protein
MGRALYYGWGATTLALFLGAFACAPRCSADEQPESQDMNAGYFLLHKLLDDESNLNILLDLKHAPKEIQDFASQISQSAKDDMGRLDKIHDADKNVNWDKNPLPKMEQDIRDSIAGEKQHQLLFGTKDDDFVRALLISQVEATQYAANITKVMAQRSQDPDRRRELSRMSEHWHALHAKDFQLLKNY